MRKLLEQYVAQNPATDPENHSFEHCRYVSIPGDSRFIHCKMTLRAHDGKGQLHVSIELPIHVNRAEAEGVTHGLSRINSHLDACEAFSLNLLEGVIVYELLADAPASVKDIHDLIETVAFAAVETYSDTIVHLVADAARAVAHREQLRIQGEKESASNSVWDRLVAWFTMEDDSKSASEKK